MTRCARHSSLILFACALFLNGCGPGERRADLVFLNGSEPESLDPAIITGQPEGRIVSALFEGLTAHDADARVVPGVAERWEISPDGKIYVFHLRADARWSNGEAVTANNFVRSWERALAPSTASEYAYQLFYIENAEDYNAGKQKDFSKVRVRALDERTLEVRLNNPTPFFLDLCGFPTLMPVHMPTIEKFGNEWIKPGRIVSNGSYGLVTWRINDHIRLRANPFYWDQANVGLKVIDVLPTNKENTAYNIYHSGDADLILDKNLIPSMILDAVRGRADFHTSPFLGTYFYRFNTTRAPFKDPRVRKAIALVIDKKRIVEKMTRAGEPIASHFVPPGIPGYSSSQGLEYDPEAGRRLLAEAGYPGGRGFRNISLLFADRAVAKSVATEVQAMLRNELGIHVELAQQEWKVYLNSMSSLDYDLAASSWVGDYNDPNTFLDMFVTDGGNNRTGWSNARYDSLIRAAAKELNPRKRADIFRQAETILCRDELPIVPFYFYVGIQFYDGKKFAGIRANVLDDHPLKYIRRVMN